MHSDTNPNLLHVCVCVCGKHTNTFTSFITLPFKQGLYFAWSQIEQCLATDALSLLKQISSLGTIKNICTNVNRHLKTSYIIDADFKLCTCGFRKKNLFFATHILVSDYSLWFVEVQQGEYFLIASNRIQVSVQLTE